MNVLHLITSTRSFFEKQIEILESFGVSCTVLGVPGSYSADSPRSGLDYLRFYPRVLEATRTGDFDIVHAHYGLVAPFAIGQPIRPTVITFWGTDLMSDRLWLRSLSRIGGRLADEVIVPSNALAQCLDIDHAQIPFGIDLDLFRPIDRYEARQRVGWNTDGPIALFPYDPNRLEKDYPRALRICTSVTPSIELRTVTNVKYEDMPYYMNASDVLLVTSRRESGPMVVKEAAACNLPILSTDVGFVRETIESMHNCAICVTDREFILEMESILDDGRRSDGRFHLDPKSLESMGQQLLAVYERALANKSGHRRVTFHGDGSLVD